MTIERTIKKVAYADSKTPLPKVSIWIVRDKDGVIQHAWDAEGTNLEAYHGEFIFTAKPNSVIG